MFVYVMDEESRDRLVSLGYKLLKYDERNSVWCFENKVPDALAFELDIPCVVSSVMTF